MWEIFLPLLLLIAATLFLTQLIFRLGVKKLMAQVEARMWACEQITNRKAIPDEWLLPYRRRVASICKTGGNLKAVSKVSNRAKQQCTRQLDDLIRFYEHTNLVDSAETRRVLLASLRQQRARWETLDWAALLTTETGETT